MLKNILIIIVFIFLLLLLYHQFIFRNNYSNIILDNNIINEKFSSNDTTTITTPIYSASSLFSDSIFLPKDAFDNNLNTFWHSAVPRYNTSGAYTGPVSTVVETMPHNGEWLQIQYPTPNILINFMIVPRSGLPLRSPKNFIIAGSNDGITWDKVFESVNTPEYSAAGHNFTVNNSPQIKYYRLIIKSIFSSPGSDSINIAEWKLTTSNNNTNITAQPARATSNNNTNITAQTARTTSNNNTNITAQTARATSNNNTNITAQTARATSNNNTNITAQPARATSNNNTNITAQPARATSNNNTKEFQIQIEKILNLLVIAKIPKETPKECYNLYIDLNQELKKGNILLKNHIDELVDLINRGDIEKVMDISNNLQKFAKTMEDKYISINMDDITSNPEIETVYVDGNPKYSVKSYPRFKNASIVCNVCENQKKFICDGQDCGNIKEPLLKCLKEKGFIPDSNNNTKIPAQTARGTPSTSTPSGNKSGTPSTSTPSGNKSGTPSTSTPSGNKSGTPSTSTPSGNKSGTPSTSTPSGNKSGTPSTSTPSTSTPNCNTTTNNDKPSMFNNISSFIIFLSIVLFFSTGTIYTMYTKPSKV
jgi:hypothetical protein